MIVLFLWNLIRLTRTVFMKPSRVMVIKYYYFFQNEIIPYDVVLLWMMILFFNYRTHTPQRSRTLRHSRRPPPPRRSPFEGRLGVSLPPETRRLCKLHLLPQLQSARVCSLFVWALIFYLFFTFCEFWVYDKAIQKLRFYNQI